MVLHALWNGSATLGDGQTFLDVYFLVMVPIFIAGVWFVHWHRKREQKIVAAALPQLVAQRAIAPVEVSRLASLPGRRAWRTEARKRSGRAAARAVFEYQAGVSELAFLRYAMRLGTAAPDAPDQEAKLVAVLAKARATAVRQAGLAPLETTGDRPCATGEAGHGRPGAPGRAG